MTIVAILMIGFWWHRIQITRELKIEGKNKERKKKTLLQNTIQSYIEHIIRYVDEHPSRTDVQFVNVIISFLFVSLP